MKRRYSLLTGLMAFSLAAALLAGAARSAGAAEKEGFDYPELLVTPKASERLQMEASRERDRRWMTHLPAQLSSLTTLTAGILQLGSPDPSKDPNGKTGFAGVAVGGGWLVVTLAMDALYAPYDSALSEVNALPNKGQRDQLVRERMAEEAISRAARVGRTIQWLSVVTNLGASVYMASQATSGSIQLVADGVAAAFSLAPLLFQYRWQDVAHEQREYKKRIYAPIASATALRDSSGRWAPGLGLSMSF